MLLRSTMSNEVVIRVAHPSGTVLKLGEEAIEGFVRQIRASLYGIAVEQKKHGVGAAMLMHAAAIDQDSPFCGLLIVAPPPLSALVGAKMSEILTTIHEFGSEALGMQMTSSKTRLEEM